VGASPVTSQDVADKAGVSRTTVSLVLNEVPGAQISQQTRQRVIRVASELGYVPDAAAQALASRRSRIIGLILTRRTQHIISDAYITQTLDGLLEVAHQNDLRLMIDIIQPYHQEEAYWEMVRSKRIDGILLSGPRFDDKALNLLEKEGFPTVLIGQLPDSEFYCVDVDNCAAARTAVNHLINLGHSKIACIINAPASYSSATDRLKGYREAIESAGFDFIPDLIRYGDFDVESGYNQMRSLLQSGVSFSAVFVASDLVALGAKAAIREHGLGIPDDIAMVGFDDLPIAKYFSPPLTTIHLPAIELARQAGELLIRLLKNDHPKRRQIILDADLVIRESCGYSTKNKARSV